MPDTWKGEDRRKIHSICDLHCILTERITAMGIKVDATHKAIFGNGDPTKSLYWMVEENTKFINTVKRIFWPLVTFSMIGVLSAFATLIKDVFFHLNQ